MFLFYFKYRESLKKAIKAKDSYRLVMEKVKRNTALKKQQNVEASAENAQRGMFNPLGQGGKYYLHSRFLGL